MSFSLISAENGMPLEGVRITAKSTLEGGSYQEVGITDSDGACKVLLPYMRNLEGPFVHFELPDGSYAPKDTTLADLRERTVLVKLHPAGQ